MPVAVDTDFFFLPFFNMNLDLIAKHINEFFFFFFLVNTSILGWKVKSPTMSYKTTFLGKFYILTTTSFGHK